MADDGKEFPDEFSPVPTPLTGSERILVEKGTATIDDVKAFARTNLPTPSAASDAATKAYVDSQSGGGGGGTPGHVICNVVDADPPFEPVPQRSNLIFIQGEEAEWEAMDFEEFDATVLVAPTVSRLESYGDGDAVTGGRAYGRVRTDAWGVPGVGNGEVYISTSRGVDPGSPSQEAWLLVSSRDNERGIRASTSGAYEYLGFFMGWAPSKGTHIEFTGAPVSVETPQEPGHAATKAYVDSKVASWASSPAHVEPDANAHRVTNVGAPTQSADAATKGYVDGIAGLAASISEGELPLTRDTGNDSNVSAASAGPLRFTRIGRTVTLSGLIQLTATAAGAATAAFTGVAGAALPATNNTWRGIITDQSSGAPKNLNIMTYPNGDFRYTVVGAEAGASYRLSFVMTHRSAA